MTATAWGTHSCYRGRTKACLLVEGRETWPVLLVMTMVETQLLALFREGGEREKREERME